MRGRSRRQIRSGAARSRSAQDLVHGAVAEGVDEDLSAHRQPEKTPQDDLVELALRQVEIAVAGVIRVGRAQGGAALDRRAVENPFGPRPGQVVGGIEERRLAGLFERERHAHRAQPDLEIGAAENPLAALPGQSDGHLLHRRHSQLGRLAGERLELSAQHAVGHVRPHRTDETEEGIFVDHAVDGLGAREAAVRAAERVRLRRGDARRRHRPRVDHRAVGGPGQQDDRIVRRHRIEHLPRGRRIEDHRLADEHQDPLTRLRHRHPLRHLIDRLLQSRPGPGDVDRRQRQARQADAQVGMGVVESRHHHPSAEVDRARARSRQSPHRPVVAHGDDPRAADGDRLRPGPAGVGREDLAVVEDDVGRWTGECGAGEKKQGEKRKKSQADPAQRVAPFKRTSPS